MANARSIASYLRAQSVTEPGGRPITDEMVEKAMAWVPDSGTTKPSPLSFANADWRAHAGEHDRSAGGILDEMFKVSGYSSFGVPKDPDDKVPEWCGMAVVSWLLKAGMDPDLNTSFLHAFNVEAFFTYGAQRNVNTRRLDTEVFLDGKWIKIADWHKREGKMRVWVDRATIRSTPLAQLKFEPGDVMLIDWAGANDADHITIVESYDGKILTTKEGNRTGLGPNGEKWSESVVECKYDLSNPKVLRLIYGFGKLSSLDFQPNAYR